LEHDPIACVVPTLIQEFGPGARPVEDKRAELVALPAQSRLTAADVELIRTLGDNTGSMALKGANPAHTGDERPDAWALNERLGEVARRWGIEPRRDLALVAA
jgi:Ser/Thr protein kinase RdoA (MazF antagonist)